MPKFKEGDRVTIIGDADEPFNLLVVQPTKDELGLQGTVIHVNEYLTLVPDYDVALDDGGVAAVNEEYLESIA